MSDEEEYDFDQEGTQAGLAVTDWTDDGILEGHVPMGVTEVDREIGGVAEGSIVALIIDPRGVGDLFCYHLASSAPSKYITTTRPKSAIERNFEQFGATEGVPPYTDIVNTRNTSSGDPKQAVQNILRRDDDSKNHIIDTFTALAGDDPAGLIRQLYASLSEQEGITYLVFTTSEGELTREEEQAVHLCDAVFNASVEYRGQNNIQHVLSVTKMRGSRSLPGEKIRLEVDDVISIDRTQTG